MSGRLVGEVMDNVAALRERGLSQRAVVALLVIAEGCRDNRVGRAPRARIAEVLGGSEKTASRAIADLRAAGVVALLAKGNRGVSGGVPALYRIALFGPESDQAPADDDNDETPGRPVDNLNDGTPECPVDNSLDGNDGTPECPVDSVDNPVDESVSTVSTGHFGPIDGTPGCPPSRTPVKESRGYLSRERYDGPVPVVPPSRRCMNHHNSTNVPACGACADARRAFEVWEAAHLGRMRSEATERRSAVQACGRCDEYGWELGHDDVAVKCSHRPALRVVGQ